MSKPSSVVSRKREPYERFEDRVAILLDELKLAIQWGRPSILLAVYRVEFLRSKAELFLKDRLLEVGQAVFPFEVNEKQIDIPLILSRHPNRHRTVFFVSGLRWGGGRDGYNAYHALNLHREYFVSGQIRVVFWLTESEAAALPYQAPDFWAFRHRVVEFIKFPPRKRSIGEGVTWRDWNPYGSQVEIETEIALREHLLATLPDDHESQAVRADLLYVLAALYRAKEEPEKSIDFLEQGLKIVQVLPDPSLQARFWAGLGFVFHDLRQMDNATSAYQKAVELNPNEAVTWSNLSTVYRDLSRTREAIEACKKAIRLDPRDARPWNNLGNVYFDLGRKEEAIQAYQKAGELAPGDSRPLNNLGSVYRSQGHAQDALQAYQAAVQINPQDCEAWNNMGSLQSSLDNVVESMRAYQRAVALCPRDARIWNSLGHLHRSLDQIPEAFQAYKKAVELDPHEINYRLSLIACYRLSGQEAEAKEQLEVVGPMMIKENEYNRACFESIRGNVDKALELLEVALRSKLTTPEIVYRDPNLGFIKNEQRFQALMGAY